MEEKTSNSGKNVMFGSSDIGLNMKLINVIAISMPKTIDSINTLQLNIFWIAFGSVTNIKLLIKGIKCLVLEIL